jgi:CII-binding regulator of phage lambda lysogenization HflD
MSFAAETEKLVKDLVQAEYGNATDNWGGNYNSLHEGYAVLKEEIEEVRDEYNSLLSNYHYLWENIKDNDKDILSTIAKMQNDVIRQIKELAQVGAVLMKIKNTISEMKK